ncbi:cupredoxin domain-containing protein [Microbulbifer flavimaris]|uniref:Cupredoxin domain-containing protein n=1 Tax=Microbulbifer flavimaris TaxID=1781068 RepID=A0ABX4I0Y8_9GAMM|nr:MULTISPECIES: cupredoxin domain-containing protein [Microbulbifer]KUJ83565.1 plastocyanin [Microbulbifer sp. ZGT114]PCO05723.1 cupredoxin domain-containing protein [Microbulbifer flavimaris]
MLTLIVNLAGLLLIAAIVWWFWLTGRTGDAAAAGPVPATSVEILVKDGVYDPDHITLPAGSAATLQFRREDPSPCAEYVLFPDLEVSAQLAVHEVTEVQLPAAGPGKYPFTCQMQMYRGLLEIK